MEKTKQPVLEREIREVLAQYGGEIAAKHVFFRGIPGGFSGSRVWEVNSESSGGHFLKRWPKVGPDFQRLTLIHGVLKRLSDLGQLDESALPPVAAPARNRA